MGTAADAFELHHSSGSSSSSSSDDAARRRRIAQRSRSKSPVPEPKVLTANSRLPGAGISIDEDADERQGLLDVPEAGSHGSTANHDSTAFDGISVQHSDSAAGSAGDHGSRRRRHADRSAPPWKRRFPGLADFWDAVTPDLVAVALVYLVQGLLDITILAINYFLKDALGMTPARAGLWVSLAKVPWMIKPLWGFLSDAFPIGGYRRRSYLIIVNLIGVSGWLGLGFVASTPVAAMFFLLATNLGLAFGDVIVDALVVDLARGESAEHAGSLQSLCWASRAVGSIGSAWFSGWLVGLLGPRFVFLLSALFPLGVTCTAFMIHEQRVDPLHGEGGNLSAEGRSKAWALLVSQATMLWSAIRRRSIWGPLIFTFFWTAAPTTESAMFFFQTNRLGFSAEFLGRIQLFQGLAELLGVWVFNRYLKSTPLRKILGWTLVAGTVSGMTQLVLVTGANRALGLSDKLFALGDSVIITALTRVAAMPVLVLSARICPEGVEATLFATLMSVYNASASTSASLGSGLTALFGVTATNFTHLAALVVVCTLSRLLALPLLLLLPSKLDADSPGAAQETDALPVSTKNSDIP